MSEKLNKRQGLMASTGMMSMAPLPITICVYLLAFFSRVDSGLNPLAHESDKNLNTEQFIKSRGYGYEFHPIITDDGYYIAAHRIINPLNPASKRPVLFVTGVGGYSVEWLRNSPGGFPNETLTKVGPNIGFETAKRGYDTWLMDIRGSILYSYKHVKYDADHDLEYWDFSDDEIAFFDLANTIDYIRRLTGNKKIGLVATQLTTSCYFFLASKVKRFNDNIAPFIALAPGFGFNQAISSNILPPVAASAVQVLKLKRGVQAPQGLVRAVEASMCNSRMISRAVCNPLLFAGSEFMLPGSLNVNRLAVYMSGPSYSTSSWQAAHRIALGLTRRVTMLDVDPVTNMKRYGSLSPPEYNASMITNPEMHFISATNDQIYNWRDLARFKRQLGVRVKSELEIPIQWSVMSYQDGAPHDVILWVNRPIIRILESYD